MRHLLSAFAVAAGLAWSIPPAAAQEVTATCKDGTAFTGASRRGACRGHGGVQAFGAAGASPAASPATTPAPATPAAPPTAPAPVAAPAPAAPRAASPSPTTTATPAAPPSRPGLAGTTAVAAGGGAGQVWVNKATKVYHCPGTRYYGKTQSGAYMTEAAATAEGDRPNRGKGCS